MPAGPRLPRRAAIALGAAGLVAVAACDDGTDQPGPRASSTPSADETPDEMLVDRTVAKITAVWRLTADRPALAALHRAHVEALDGEIEVAPVRGPVDPTELRKREQQLQAALVAAAMAADSGELARLLASMSAAVSQRLVTL